MDILNMAELDSQFWFIIKKDLEEFKDEALPLNILCRNLEEILGLDIYYLEHSNRILVNDQMYDVKDKEIINVDKFDIIISYKYTEFYGTINFD